MTFEQWKSEVNKWLIETVGVDSDDLEDYRWYDDYKEGIHPIVAAEDFLDQLED